ncbi:hypothetical protein HSBAA_34810 [Vreelandella sulfidaeris]|uniref:Thiolase N-terminal domain-containing protein n=1 Tax=Vreelandella sulfidaeris TaxID=115553 RepID=A0A455U895_9GAMM|nr:hypothetical protein HSBAA_34810 [Halomonas sulfidaeris]
MVTAGNASGLNDGAAAMIVGSLSAGERAGLAPRARIVCPATRDGAGSSARFAKGISPSGSDP